MTKLKKAGMIVALLFIALIAFIFIAVYKIQGTGPETGATELRFTEIPFEHVHTGDLDGSLPFMGLACVDIDGDSIDEVYVGGGKGQQDAIFAFSPAGFIRQKVSGIDKDEDDTTFGIASIDTTGDANEELFIARESGVYYAENVEGGFQQRKLDFGMAKSTTALSIALADINQDGWVDLYVAGYIKLEYAEGETNFSDNYGGFSYLLLNDGTNHWTDISKEAGIFRQHNTFLGVFVDLNADQWPDLVVAQDTGKVEIWENLKNNTFARHSDPTDYAYPMGIGVGDIDNDGDVDLYFSNVGNTLPRLMLIGNLTEEQKFNMDYILLRNDGDFQFTDVSVETNAAQYGFGWGTTIADFNNDSHMDLYFSQNYARFPGVNLMKLYPGRLLEQQTDGTFLSVEESAGLSNQNFGITQIVSDFNQDGNLDIVIANLTGPARAFLGQGSAQNRGLSVRLPASPEWLNTVGRLTRSNGPVLTRQLMASEGLCSDGYHGLHFGLGEDPQAVSLTLTRPDGMQRTYEDVAIGETLVIKQ